MKKINIVFSIAALAGLLLGSTVVSAAPNAKLSSTIKSDYSSLDYDGGKIMVGMLDGVAEVHSSITGKLPNGLYRQRCAVRIHKSSLGLDLTSNCVMTDSGGDTISLSGHRGAGEVQEGGGGDGKLTLVSGTGKFAGISGQCVYNVSWLPDQWISVESNCVVD